ncbi:MAG: hypothetical protein SPE06_02595 [[Actinobacillus] rossii]|uniref:D-ribulose-phosphate-3 epimerase n=1 Tax=[Actinobacillus] rossii TaxID=123820 RepID=A0A380TQ43_9PAST|nr:hypothetical protein [[Actinobacillus] rossii]MDY4505293.1 hypothetical protein [[Actinobacillus] rossii]SUT89055.1 D-ribulose-phosphate-3 epimerase [[Actinobacillus] rossii]
MNNDLLIQELKQQNLSVGILASPWLEFNQVLNILKTHKLNILHFDVADGNFSPLFTVGSIAIKQFSQDYFKDIHLMVNNQQGVVEDCIRNGANLITLQLENRIYLRETLQWIRTQYNTYKSNEYSVLAGLSLFPETELSLLGEYIDDVDVIQLLTLNPISGKKFDVKIISNRIQELWSIFGDELDNKIISVDGAMTLEMANYLSENCRVNWFVSGSALFKADLSYNLQSWEKVKNNFH